MKTTPSRRVALTATLIYVAALLAVVAAAGTGTLPYPNVVLAVTLAVPAIDLATRRWRGVPLNLARRHRSDGSWWSRLRYRAGATTGWS